jgi:thiamine biosynthesis lipoprotein ApbE
MGFGPGPFSSITLYFLPLAAALLASCEVSPASTRGGDGITVYLTEEEALKTVFPDAIGIVKERVILSAGEHRQMEKILGTRFPERGFTVHAGIRKGGQLDGFAVIHAEVGKFKFFHFIVGVEPDGGVRRVAVLVYRESRGGEVATRRFSVQYDGKTIADPIHINRDVINIAGATMSVNSLNSGVKKVLALLEVVYRRQPERLRALLASAPEMAKVRPGALNSDSIRPDLTRTARRLERQDRGVVEFRDARYLMGSVCEILAYGEDHEALRMAVSRAFLEVEAAERVLSDYRPSSELSLISQRGGEMALPVSDLMGEFLLAAENISQESGGAFALTLGPLVRAWGFRGKMPRSPTADDLEALRPLLGPENILLSRAENRDSGQDGGRGWTVRLAREGVQLDPGALGKGFAVDRAVRSLRGDGVRSALVNFSGNIYALGAPPGEPAWEVAVRDPTRPDSVLGVLQLRDAAIAASGSYEKYGHILSPRTLRPVRDVLGTAVVAPSATLADGYSTAAFVLAGECSGEAIPFLRKKRGVEGFIARRTDDRSVSFACTKGWRIP